MKAAIVHSVKWRWFDSWIGQKEFSLHQCAQNGSRDHAASYVKGRKNFSFSKKKATEA
jgi:hypothetical protein